MLWSIFKISVSFNLYTANPERELTSSGPFQCATHYNKTLFEEQ